MSYKSSLVIFTILFAIMQFGSSAPITEECEHTHINGSGQIFFGLHIAHDVLRYPIYNEWDYDEKSKSIEGLLYTFAKLEQHRERFQEISNTSRTAKAVNAMLDISMKEACQLIQDTIFDDIPFLCTPNNFHQIRLLLTTFHDTDALRIAITKINSYGNVEPCYTWKKEQMKMEADLEIRKHLDAYSSY